MPSEPVISIQELARICATALKRRRNAVIGAIRQALTPTPIKARAAVSPAKLCAEAKATQPSTAATNSTSITRLGP